MAELTRNNVITRGEFGVNLEGNDISGLDLTGASLTNADLTRANLSCDKQNENRQ